MSRVCVWGWVGGWCLNERQYHVCSVYAYVFVSVCFMYYGCECVYAYVCFMCCVCLCFGGQICEEASVY